MDDVNFKVRLIESGIASEETIIPVSSVEIEQIEKSFKVILPATSRIFS